MTDCRRLHDGSGPATPRGIRSGTGESAGRADEFRGAAPSDFVDRIPL